MHFLHALQGMCREQDGRGKVCAQSLQVPWLCWAQVSVVVLAQWWSPLTPTHTGGHTAEMIKIVEALGIHSNRDKYNTVCYLIAATDAHSEKRARAAKVRVRLCAPA